MREQTRRIQATTHKLVLTKDNISKIFVKMGNRRKLRKGIINKLVRVLESGKHFETPLMTNRVNEKERLLDGNHRVEAIEKYLDKYPNMKVEVWVFSYDNLNTDDEKKMYTIWNLGTKQNTNDYIKQYWNDISIVKKMRSNGFPCDVSPFWTSSSIEFKILVAGYLGTKESVYNGGFTGNPMEFIELSKQLDEKDYNIIKSFLKEYISVFGNPDKKNPHYSQSIFCGLFRIWSDNLHQRTFEEINNAFIKLRGHERVIYYCSLGWGRQIANQCRIDLLNAINNNRTKNLFV